MKEERRKKKDEGGPPLYRFIRPVSEEGMG